MASLTVSPIATNEETLLNTVYQLRSEREKEGDIKLDENDIRIIGVLMEPLNPNKRLLLLVKLKTPYLDLLGNLHDELPFYRSSGKYSGKEVKDHFHPFFGIMSNLGQEQHVAAAYKYLENFFPVLKTIKPKIKNQLMLVEWLIKCGYFNIVNDAINLNVFLSHPMEWRNEFGNIFQQDPNIKQGRLCNEYLKKYADALMVFSESNPNYFISQVSISEHLSAMNINRAIGDNSIFGFNINNATLWADNKRPIHRHVEELIASITSTLDADDSDTMKIEMPDPNDTSQLITEKEYLYRVIDYLNEGTELPTLNNIIDYIKDWYDLQNTGVGEQLRQFLKCLENPPTMSMRAQSSQGFEDQHYKCSHITAKSESGEEGGAIDSKKTGGRRKKYKKNKRKTRKKRKRTRKRRKRKTRKKK